MLQKLLAGAVALCTACLVFAAPLAIDVQPGSWGNAHPRDIEAVLGSVAEVLLPHFPRHASARVSVAFSPHGPKVLVAKTADGAHRVLLSVQDRRWDQFAYQFAHELCHIFTNYDERPIASTSTALARDHQWFEEALCEAVSVVALQRLSAQWQHSPPRTGWQSYAPAFATYAARVMRAAPAPESVAAWYQREQLALKRDPYRREKNAQFASALIELIDNMPGALEALGYLNLEARSHQSFGSYLAHWHDCCPAEQRAFAARVIALLAVD